MVKQTTSPDGLGVRVKHHHNPYGYLFSGDEFDQLLLELGVRRAQSIWRNHTAVEPTAPRGVYERACMAFVLMDPTAGPWTPNPEAVLAAVVIGEGGERFLPNAAAKAGGHRRLGRNYGEAVHVDPHLSGSGHFRYGHSAQVRGLIVGSSSQTTDQDLFEAGMLAKEFVDAIDERHRAWERETGVGEWLSADGVPGTEHQTMVAWFS